MMTPIGVGIIGASPLSPGWAVATHLPAIAALPDFALRAVSTSRRESAEAAAEAFAVAAYDNHEQLIDDPAVDLVVVAVKVPHHRVLIERAFAAGKMVFSEWPLGIDLDESAALADLARQRGVRTFIGLQARYAPAVLHARRLLDEGRIGRVLGSSLAGSGMAWGDQTDRAHTYMFDGASGANVLSVPMMHTLDAVHAVLGEFEDVTAVSGIRRPSVAVVDGGADHPVSAPDHVAVAGRLAGGAILSLYYRGAMTKAENFRWEINGTAGDILITAENGNMQVADLRLAVAVDDGPLTPIELEKEYASAPHIGAAGMGANVLREYAAIASDLRTDSYHVPDFDFAVRRHRELHAIEEAARAGVRQAITA